MKHAPCRLAAALDGGDGHARDAAWLRARGDRRGDALALALEHDAQDVPDPIEAVSLGGHG
ncbi:MAG: hypothetical protein IPH44_03290 [Myxococcales bacterium]|nr:hypothetical protein [Myxococcales bacterium]